jgi:pimeloyl-ACP methyl ester carboxylesterase
MSAPNMEHPIVLLHSSASSARQWQRTIEALPPRFAARTVEFHGHGAQAAWSGSAAMTLADEAALVEALLEKVGPAHIVGHSYGGAVALKAAMQRPHLVRSVVAYEPVLFRLLRDDPASWREIRCVTAVADGMRQRLADGQPPAAAQQFIDFWSGPGAWSSLSPDRQAAFAARAAAVVRQFDALFNDALSVRDLARLRMPLLLLSGTHTVPATRRIAHLVAAAQPTVQCEALDRLGHMGPVTHPPAFNQRLIEFLSSLPLPRRWKP